MGKVKLYIFDSPDDVARFEHPLQTVTVGPVAPEEFGGGKPVRHYKKREKDPEIEAQKKRILEKAKGMGKGRGTPHCKNCGGAGHRSNFCPKNKPSERFDSHAEDEE